MEYLRKTLLIVEDDVIIALSSKQQLEDLGYTVIAAYNGRDAVSLVQTNQNIDMILMDIDLGTEKDGTDIAREILCIKKIPIIFVSSHTEPAIISKTERITSYGYIVKNSSFTVYDVSIKMAFKLFDANRQKVWAEKVLESALDFLPQAVFISDRNGTLFRINTSFAKIQKFDDRSECIKHLKDYPETFDVYTENGDLASLEEWALSRALNGEHRENVKYYIVRKDIKDFWIGHYSFRPIFDEANAIDAAIVTMTDATHLYPGDPILKTLKDKYGL